MLGRVKRDAASGVAPIAAKSVRLAARLDEPSTFGEGWILEGIALGCCLLGFSVLMDCVVWVGDWDILGVWKRLGDGGVGETPKNVHGYILLYCLCV